VIRADDLLLGNFSMTNGTSPREASKDLPSVSQSSSLSVVKLTGILLLVQILPSLLHYLGLDASHAIGTAAVSATILAIFVATQAIGWNRKDARRSEWGSLLFAATCVLLVVPHAAVANNFQATDLGRFFKTLPLLFLLVGGGAAFGHMLLRATEREIDVTLTLSLVILSVSVPFSILGLQPQMIEGGYEKSMFPFTETSHFALAFAPVFVYRCVKSEGHARSLWLSFGFILAILLYSVTFLMACVLAALACRRLLLVGLIGVVLVIGVVPFEFDYFTSRLAGGEANLSSLVYLQGWQLMVEALTRSFGWGVGFQQLGVQGTNVSAADAIYLLASIDSLNVLDGGFVFAKLAAEFGVLGMLLGALFLIVAARSMLALRRGRERAAIMFARCVVVCFFVDMFARGTGYFSGSTLLAITAISILVNDRRHLDLSRGEPREALLPSNAHL
jgi:hypothetical protein